MSFKEIYDNRLFVPSKLSDSMGNGWEEQDVFDKLPHNDMLILGEPGSGKSFFSYCLMRKNIEAGYGLFLPMDLRTIYELKVTCTFEDIIYSLFGNVGLDADMVFVVDGIDEFCGTDKRDAFCKNILNILKTHGKLCVLCRRYEYDLYISNIVKSNMFAKILNVKEWRRDDEFLTYLHTISDREGIDAEEIYNAVKLSGELSELIKRPLHARMLIYVIKTNFRGMQHIRCIADLYEQYFASLAATVQGIKQQDILICWRKIAWHLFKSTATVNRKIYVSEIGYSICGKYSVEKIMAPIVNWSNDMGRKSFTFLHYSFYEFLVAYNFVLDLDDRLEKDDLHSARALFKKDFPPEMRHYATMLLENNAKISLWNKLILLYEYPTDNPDLTERCITNNLIFYFMGRISNVKADELRKVLEAENDIFLKSSLYWAACNLNYTDMMLEYLGILRDENYASYNRGYLLYYYGDLDRSLQPPYVDDNVKICWKKTRLNNMTMFNRTDYIKISPARRIIDIYTFLDFSKFHRTMLSDEEICTIDKVIGNIKNADKNIAKAVSILKDIWRSNVCEENGFQ